MRFSIGKRGTWLNALAMNGVYISPIVWFVAGLYEESVGSQISNLFSGAVMTVIAYQFVKYAVQLTAYVPSKKYYKDAMQAGEALGMIKAIQHLQNGGTVESLVMKSRVKMNKASEILNEEN